jgi:phosphoribosyl-ATP pyrophosphohydrolase
VAVIDLDAAMGKGNNRDLILALCKEAPVRVGGGIRDVETAQTYIRAGAQRIIVGTAATPEFLQALHAKRIPPEKIMVAIDHRDGQVVDQGWTHTTGEAFITRAERLAPHCGAFLCTFVAEEGGMGGMDLERIQDVVARCPRPVTVAGGVASTEEAITLSRMGVDVQVGMALYTGKLDPVDVLVGAAAFDRYDTLPTIVQDTAGQVLMLAYSTPESLSQALRTGKGVYYSRSRQTLWEKGKTSGHTQQLKACRLDCDHDTLLFTVEQTGVACHTGSYSCFGAHMALPQFNTHRLFDVLRLRQRNMPAGSYTARLFQERPYLLRKLMEEAFETTLAAGPEAGDTREGALALTWELADLLYFMSVLAVDAGLDWANLEAELSGRHGG